MPPGKPGKFSTSGRWLETSGFGDERGLMKVERDVGFGVDAYHR